MINIDAGIETKLENALMLGLNEKLFEMGRISEDEYLEAKREIVSFSRLTANAENGIIIVRSKNNTEKNKHG